MKRFRIGKRDCDFVNKVFDFMDKVYTVDEDWNTIAAPLTKKV